MYKQLNTQLFVGIPNLYRNTTLLVPNVPSTLYIDLRAIYCTNIFSLCIILTYNAPHRRSCCSWKLWFPANRGTSLLLVVLGKLSVRLTAFFHSIFIPLTEVVLRSHVWHPYQAVQYVCSKRILIWSGTTRNCAFSLFTEPMNSPLFARISASSHISFVNIIPRYLTFSFHFTCWPFTFTWRCSGHAFLLKQMHSVFLALKVTPYSLAKDSDVLTSISRPCMLGLSNNKSSA